MILAASEKNCCNGETTLKVIESTAGCETTAMICTTCGKQLTDSKTDC